MSKVIDDISEANPFLEFETLIEQNGIEELYEAFLLDAEMLEGSLDADKAQFTFIEFDHDNKPVVYTETFADKINKVSKEAFYSCKKKISNKLSLYLDAKDKRAEIIYMLDTLNYLYQHVGKVLVHTQSDVIRQWLLEVILLLKEKYHSYIIQHSAFQLLIADKDVHKREDYFAFKGTIKDLKNLFTLLNDLSLFSEETNALDFISFFRAEDPKQTGIKIKLGCELGKAAFIINMMYPMFHNMNDKTLIYTDCLLTLQGKHVTYSSFQKQRSNFKKNLHTEDERIIISDRFKTFDI